MMILRVITKRFEIIQYLAEEVFSPRFSTLPYANFNHLVFSLLQLYVIRGRMVFDRGSKAEEIT